jgi:hypothetical protein
MGIDFTALLDHRLSWDELYELPTLLRDWTPPPELLLARDEIPRFDDVWAWDRDRRYSNVAEELFETHHLEMSGPAGFSLVAFRDGVQVHHLYRWWSFVSDPVVRGTLRAAIRSISRTLRATSAIYVPDSSAASDHLFDGEPFSSVINALKLSVGEPTAFDLLPEDRTDVYAIESLTSAG